MKNITLSCFPGQYYDPETGLHYNYFRYYDPSTGRYVTPDPIGLEGGINLFAYVANNPVNWIDPEGITGWKPIPGFPKWRVKGERHPGVPYHLHFEYERKRVPRTCDPVTGEQTPHGRGRSPGENKDVPQEVINAARELFGDRNWELPYDVDFPGKLPNVPLIPRIPSMPPDKVIFP